MRNKAYSIQVPARPATAIKTSGTRPKLMLLTLMEPLNFQFHLTLRVEADFAGVVEQKACHKSTCYKTHGDLRIRIGTAQRKKLRNRAWGRILAQCSVWSLSKLAQGDCHGEFLYFACLYLLGFARNVKFSTIKGTMVCPETGFSSRLWPGPSRLSA